MGGRHSTQPSGRSPARGGGSPKGMAAVAAAASVAAAAPRGASGLPPVHSCAMCGLAALPPGRPAALQPGRLTGLGLAQDAGISREQTGARVRFLAQDHFVEHGRGRPGRPPSVPTPRWTRQMCAASGPPCVPRLFLFAGTADAAAHHGPAGAPAPTLQRRPEPYRIASVQAGRGPARDRRGHGAALPRNVWLVLARTSTRSCGAEARRATTFVDTLLCCGEIAFPGAADTVRGMCCARQAAPT